jgi:5-methyltetrahydropteroyltriglutamate--homocysteine methyltransferase
MAGEAGGPRPGDDQSGFSSHETGNELSHDEQWRKLELVVRVARKVWGTAN